MGGLNLRVIQSYGDIGEGSIELKGTVGLGMLAWETNMLLFLVLALHNMCYHSFFVIGVIHCLWWTSVHSCHVWLINDEACIFYKPL